MTDRHSVPTDVESGVERRGDGRVPTIRRPAGSPDGAFGGEVAGRLLRRLGSAWMAIVVASVAGGVLAGAGTAYLRPSYRATATLLVVEPRVATAHGAVDFNLTPIRSYRALATSPVVIEACFGILGPEDRGKTADEVLRRLLVRVPEHTRLVEISFDGPDRAVVAELVNCVAERAIEENRRINGLVADRAAALIASAGTDARRAVEAVERAVVEVRGEALLELTRARLRASLADLESATAAEQRAALALVEARERRRGYEETAATRSPIRTIRSVLALDPETVAARERAGGGAAAGEPVVRDEADPVHDLAVTESAHALAAERAAVAAMERAAKLREDAAHRAAEYERAVVAVESRVTTLGKQLEAAAAALSELERREALVRLDAATKAFELVTIAPAAPPAAPSRSRILLAGIAGALAAAVIGGILALSVPRRPSVRPVPDRNGDGVLAADGEGP